MPAATAGTAAGSAQPVGDFLRNMAWKITVFLEDPHEQPGRRGTPDLIVVCRCRPTVGWITLAEHRSFNLRCLGPGPLRRSGPALWDALRLEHDHERAAQFAWDAATRWAQDFGYAFPERRNPLVAEDLLGLSEPAGRRILLVGFTAVLVGVPTTTD